MVDIQLPANYNRDTVDAVIADLTRASRKSKSIEDLNYYVTLTQGLIEQVTAYITVAKDRSLRVGTQRIQIKSLRSIQQFIFARIKQVRKMNAAKARKQRKERLVTKDLIALAEQGNAQAMQNEIVRLRAKVAELEEQTEFEKAQEQSLIARENLEEVIKGGYNPLIETPADYEARLEKEAELDSLRTLDILSGMDLDKEGLL